MSARNGDRSRFGRLRKQKMRKREITRLRVKEAAAANATTETSAPKSA